MMSAETTSTDMVTASWPRVSAVLRWPSSLRRQIELIFLASLLLNMPIMWATAPQRWHDPYLAAYVVAGMTLCAMWAHGFSRGEFRPWSDVFELLLLFIAGLAPVNPSIVLGPVYGVVFFRNLYGGHRAAVIRTLSYAAVMDALVIIHPVDDSLMRPGPLMTWLTPSLVLCAVAMRALAVALDRQEAAGRRGQAFTKAAVAFLAARGTGAAELVGLELVEDLLEDPEAACALLLRHGDRVHVSTRRPETFPEEWSTRMVEPRDLLLEVPVTLGSGTTLVVRPGSPLTPPTRASVESSLLQIAMALDNARLQLDLDHKAHHDELTDLPNRRQLGEHLRNVLAAGHDVAIAFIDLDDFKTVNDALGHQAGDHLLRAVTARLHACQRDTDLVGRLGGDEFAVILRDITKPEDALTVAERMLESLNDKFIIDSHELTVRSSVGIRLGGPGDDPVALLRDADTAMYHAKARGKSRCELFSHDMHAAVSRELTLRGELRAAVRNDELRVHFQPIVRLEDGGILGAEALVRWEHPRLGLIAPLDFLPLAESTGAIVDVDLWVLERACVTAAGWPAGSDGRLPYLSVNFSPSHLQRFDVITPVEAALRESGLDPQRLLVEVTENVDAQDWDRVTQALIGLRRLGVRTALDDFGTGYSSLSILSQLPIDVLKVDRTFTADPANRLILESIFDMSSRLGLSAVVEGVETSDQKFALQEAGCALGQGYLFSPPVPAEQFTALLAAQAGETAARPGW